MSFFSIPWICQTYFWLWAFAVAVLCSNSSNTWAPISPQNVTLFIFFIAYIPNLNKITVYVFIAFLPSLEFQQESKDFVYPFHGIILSA